MASSNTTTTPFDPLNQRFTILGPDGETPIPTPAFVTSIYMDATSLTILYGTQSGGCFMMLLVVLGMTPRSRLRRIPTIINIVALLLNAVRMLLLALFFTSSWLNMYTLASGDVGPVRRIDYNVSAGGTALSIPTTVLIEAALVVQAWSMLQLWPTLLKTAAVAVSLALVATTVGFNFAATFFHIRFILYDLLMPEHIWTRKTYLVLLTASICWFCFLFNIRLVLHMWSNRTILPSLKGLKAMDVLVITNGILMFVPVIFSGLEFANFPNFESASLTQTSVILVLPLGTLIAQRLADPAAFSSTASDSAATNSSASGSTAAIKRPLLRRFATESSGRAGSRDGGVQRGHGSAAASALHTHIASDAPGCHGSGAQKPARFPHGEDAAERGPGGAAGADDDPERRGVWVDYDIELTEERVPVRSRWAS